MFDYNHNFLYFQSSIAIIILIVFFFYLAIKIICLHGYMILNIPTEYLYLDGISVSIYIEKEYFSVLVPQNHETT